MRGLGCTYHRRQTGRIQIVLRCLLAEAEQIPIDIFYIEVLASPWSLFKRLHNRGSARLKLLEQGLQPGNIDVCVEVFVLLPMRSVAQGFRRALQVYGRAIAAHPSVERVVDKVGYKPQLISVVRDRLFEVVNQELGGDGSYPRSVDHRGGRHVSRSLRLDC